MHWLTFIFAFLTLYCGAGFIYSLVTGGVADAQNALVMFGVGAVVFAFASFINQKRHSYARKRISRAQVKVPEGDVDAGGR